MKFLKKYFPYFLFFYHALFAYFGWQYVLKNGGDSTRYWFLDKDLAAISWSDFLNPGTDFVQLLTFPLVKFLHLPFGVGFFLFSAIGFFGFYKLYKIALKQTKISENPLSFYLLLLLLLLPNLHFWTALIGKESLIFPILVVLAERLLKEKIFTLGFLVCFLLLAVLRPHVAFVFLLALVIAILLKSTVSTRKKIITASLFFAMIPVLYFLLTKIANLRGNPFVRLKTIYARHIEVFKTTNSYVPLDQYNIFEKFFTFYFRPFPWEKNDFFYHILGIENLILFAIVLFLLIKLVQKFKTITLDFFDVFTLLFLFFFGLMYVYGYANFGIIVRTKTMVMAFVYLLILKTFSSLKTENLSPHPLTRKDIV